MELLMTLTRLITGTTFAVVAGLALVACGSGGPAATNSGSSSGAAQLLSYMVVGPEDATTVGPDGAKHDVFMSMGATSVKVGVPVTITITNKDGAMHSMTSAELGFNIIVPAATDKADGTVSYTFTPTKTGSFRWFCALPCDTDNEGWDMTSDGTGNGQNNFMAGTITVTN
ncbi:MAG: hypothetical protein ABI838_00470 [Chloroflexota bacterium]